MDKKLTYDVIIVGTGLAGLTLALRLPDSMNIALVSKGRMSQGSSYWAQGGVSAVMEESDSIESHVNDTIVAGAGVCQADVVHHTAQMGSKCIEWLIENGVNFSTTSASQGESKLHLTREGGHSHRRIVHAADATGHAIQSTLTEKVLARKNIQILEGHIAVDLITSNKLQNPTTKKTCVGIYLFCSETGEIKSVAARQVALCTGGASKVYLYSSNPESSTGDGIAMAWRAGCRVANMEFNQFHPTCLYHPRARSFLISEALRGEGAYLRLPNGERFMERFDERLELAPRDIVARAIDHEIKRLGVDHVYLDISHKPADFIQQHFPTIYKRCFELGIDITQQPIPVVPAAHYTCGGVVTDKRGRTDLPNLYVIGESACTGLHGANRLASNSLLECLVFGWSAAEDIINHWSEDSNLPAVPDWDDSRVTDSDEQVVVTHNWQELRRFMWNYVGIVRTNKRLERAKRRCDMLRTEIADYYGNFKINADLIELRNLAAVANLMINCAQLREENRGLHFSLNNSSAKTDTQGASTILTPENFTDNGTWL